MIRFDYLIKRDEGDEVRSYSPSLIPKELSDLVYIQGPNSSGKSTLLNIIALGFFGDKLKEDELNPALREKIVELKNSPLQEVTFNIEIDNNVIGKKLKAIKLNPKSKDIKVVEISGDKEKIISSDSFFSEYKLIYDIPSDPTGRFKELLREIKNNQEVYEGYVIDLRKRIDFYIDEVRSGRNPERLEELQPKKIELTEKINIQEQEIKKQEDRYHNLNLFFYQKFLMFYNDRYKQLVNNYKQKKKEQKLTEEQKLELIKYNQSLKKTKLLLPEVINLLDMILVKDDSKNRIQLLHVNFATLDSVIQKEINKELSFFNKHLEEVKNDSAINEVNFLNQLKEFLYAFMDEKIYVPATGKNVKDFISIIDDEINKKGSAIQISKNIDLCMGKIAELYQNWNNLHKQIKKIEGFKLKNIDYTSESKDSEGNANPNQDLNTQILSFQDKIKFLKNNLIELKVDPKNISSPFEGVSLCENDRFSFNNYSEEQFKQTLQNESSSIAYQKELLKKEDRKLELIVEELSRIENKKPHRYQKYLKNLEDLRKEIFSLEALFNNEFDENIKLLINPKKLDAEKLKEEQISYAEKVSEFLASKIRFIKHVDKNHEISKIDIINEKIITSSGKIILWGHLGTGQGQGAYLEGLININDNRKIIALFDEVAMMDSDTLKPIFERLVNLYKQKKLLIAIIVQKQDYKLTINDLLNN